MSNRLDAIAKAGYYRKGKVVCIYDAARSDWKWERYDSISQAKTRMRHLKKETGANGVALHPEERLTNVLQRRA